MMTAKVDMQKVLDETIVCPGCGWVGGVDKLWDGADCPACGYENGTEPYRLLTLSEMLEHKTEYNDVRLDLFLLSVFALLDEWLA